MRRFGRAPLAAALLLLVPFAQARQGAQPYSLTQRTKVGFDLPIEDVRAIDATARRAELDAREGAAGMRVKRLQVAEGRQVSITPADSGRWDTLPDGSRLWRTRVRAAGATDLRLGFSRFALPPGATLHVIGADEYYQGPYDDADAIDGRFEAPLVPGDTVTVEVRVPPEVELTPDALELGEVGAGFRDAFGLAKAGVVGASGACNVNVVCPLGQPFAQEAHAVGYFEFRADADRNTYRCTGTLLADVPRTRRNWFLTAAHCMRSASEAASVVVYWNYQSTQCNTLAAPTGGYFNDDQHGATLRARRSDVDFALIELNGTPPSSWNLYRAGWDASGMAPPGTIVLHHPSGDVKKITAGPGPYSTSSCTQDNAAPDTHWWAGPYTQGTTEGGSSGSGLFTAANAGSAARRLIGTLSGGSAACSSLSPGQPNSGGDCYGKLATAWNGADASARLRDWLDPANTGTTSLSGGDVPDAPPLPPRAHSTRPLPELLRQRSRQRAAAVP